MKRYDVEKVANAIKLFEMNKVRHLGKTKLMKLLFFADKYHLQRYGRPIFYDTYIKLPHGPVPSLTLNIIDSINETENEDLKEFTEKFRQHIGIGEKQFRNEISQTVFRPKTDFDEEHFSLSEIEILDEVSRKFKNDTAAHISDISHELPEYRMTEMTDTIDYSEMAPENREYIEYIEQTSKEFDRLFA